MIIKKNTIAKLFLFIVAVLFALYAVNILAAELKAQSWNVSATTERITIAIITVLQVLACVLFFLFFSLRLLKTSTFFHFFLIWAILVSVNLWLNINEYSGNTIFKATLMLRLALQPFFLFIFFYAIFKYYGDSLWKIFSYIIIGWYAVIALAYLTNYSAFAHMLMTGMVPTAVLGIAYILLYPLPLALCLKNKFLKWFCVAIGVIVVLSSMKRGGALAFALAMLVYYFVYNFYINRSKYLIRNMAIMLLSCILLLAVFVLYDKQVNNGIIVERINSISDDGGSGREEVYNTLIEQIPDIPIEQLIIGYGHFGSRNFSPLGYTAHNDFLEVLYDYGLIGLGIYIWLYMLMFKKLKILIKRKSEYAAPFAASITLFYFLSMISHIIIYPYFVWYAIILGVIDGNDQCVKRITKVKKYAI